LTEAPEGAFLYDGNLPVFYHSLISGHPFPLKFAIKVLEDVDTLLAIALFLHRDLAVHPTMTGIVASVSLACAEPFWGLAHIDRDLARFIQHIRKYLAQTNAGDRIPSVLTWIRDYVHTGQLPQMPPERPLPVVLTTGSDGFVLAETRGSFQEGWVELFRQGFLRGVLVGPSKNDRRAMMLARKSPVVTLDLNRLASAFNAIEQAMGEPPEWELEGETLKTPGTMIAILHILAVVSRI
jgi:hypothetical protein